MTDEERNTPSMGRRRWLALAGGSVSLGLAGCLGDDDAGDDGETDDPDGDDTQPGDGDPGNGDGGDDSDTDNGDSDTADDGDTDDPADDPDIDATLTDLQVDGDGGNVHGDTPTIDVGEGVLVSLTLTNTGDTTHDFDVELAVTPLGEDEPVQTTSTTAPLAPEESEEVTFGGVTGDLDVGGYEVTASTVGVQTTVELGVLGSTEVSVTVYEHEEGFGNELGGGTVTAWRSSTQHDSAPVGEDGTARLELPLDEHDDYTIEVEDPGDGKWAPASTNVTFDGTNTDVTLVAGHPVQGARSYRFSSYAYDETGRFDDGPEYEYLIYGVHMREFEQGTSHNAHYVRGSTAQGHEWGQPSSRPPEHYTDLSSISPPAYGTDLDAVSDEQGHPPPMHSVDVEDEDNFFFMGSSEQWTDSESPAAYSRRGSRTAVMHGLDGYVSILDGTQSYAGATTVGGTAVYVYEVPERAAYLYVDPERGYVLRYDKVKLFRDFGGDSGQEPPFENSFEIVEFWDHDDVESLDWELVQERSTDDIRTEDGEPDIDELPWEAADV